MPDPFTLAITGYIASNIPHWLEDLRSTLLNKSKEFVAAKGKEWLSEKEQERQLQQVLEKAIKRGLANFQNLQERDQYKGIINNLFETGAHGDNMRQESMTLFTLTDTPNLAKLNEIYNRSLRIRNLSQSTSPAEVNAAPYLISFFDALIAELYANPFFKNQISDVIQTRAAMVIPQYMIEANTTLRKIHGAIKDDYTEELFYQDIARYASYVERTLHNLKIIGVVPKDQNRDPELNGIFVPLRIALTDHKANEDKQQTSLVALLEQYPHLVLLGDPGSGKSTAVSHLAWSHAKVNQTKIELTDVSLLPNQPLPLRIELRFLMQDRKHHPDYSFLSHTTDVLLAREDIKVNHLMFEKLLTQQRLLILFDGLDEVSTLVERQRLVQEIEHFAQLYPGNHMLVTSRPIGYELASCSKQLFTHARVQDFDDNQIHQFLERWYKYVLRLSPLPYQEQLEFETLFKTLQENIRLHKLAENPLLLTVITALYRSQRLPEKRVQVYDKCAELLLETWAKLKGTDKRWVDMKIGKDDQFACIAHLGFKLHERSQEEKDTQDNNDSPRDTATDVPARFMLREIESFLSSRKLIVEIAEQRKEAQLFLELMQVEAGLIVERGTDENGENIYGFVHRTFQEYFASSDVYERYKQDENPTIISDFLEKHLHDPHWREVILLMLGKLGRKPVTVRLHQILHGKIRSLRSHYTNIVQQDLFFVCDCLLEEMQVESDLAESVILLLSSLVTASPFLEQSKEALNRLDKFIQTKQFANLGLRELLKLATLDIMMDTTLKVQIAEILFSHSPFDSEERRQGGQLLLQLAQSPDVSPGHRIQAAEALYNFSPIDSEDDRQAAQLLLQLAQSPDVSPEHRIQAAAVLYESSPVDSEEERRQGGQLLLQLAQSPDVSPEHRIQAAETLYNFSPVDSEDDRQATQLLLQLAQSPDVSPEYRIQASGTSRQGGQLLLQLAQSPDVSLEHRIQAAKALYNFSPFDPLQATQLLLQLAQSPDVSPEHRIQAAEALNEFSLVDPRQGGQLLLQLAQSSDVSLEHRIQAAKALYESSPVDSEERRQAAKLLWLMAQDSKITAEQRLYIVTIPMVEWNPSYFDIAQSVKRLLTLLPVEEVKSYLLKHWKTEPFLIQNVQHEEIPYIAELIKLEILPSLVRNSLYSILRSSVPQFNKIPSINDASIK